MENLTKQALRCSLLTALVLLSCPITMSQEVVDETEFCYDASDKKGPGNWADIKPEWKLCNDGNMQSPINFVSDKVKIVKNLGELKIDYKPSKATVMNRGHSIAVEWEGDNSHIEIDGNKYTLKEFHWHSPAEHAIEGTRVELELQMVHETPSGEIAVVGIMYNAGVADPFLSLLTKHLNGISSAGKKKEVGEMDPHMVKEGSSTSLYYKYIGSLTTPPCTENVSWIVLREVRSVALDQIKLLRHAVDDHSKFNARPVQEINDRLVQYNNPDHN